MKKVVLCRKKLQYWEKNVRCRKVAIFEKKVVLYKKVVV